MRCVPSCQQRRCCHHGHHHPAELAARRRPGRSSAALYSVERLAAKRSSFAPAGEERCSQWDASLEVVPLDAGGGRWQSSKLRGAASRSCCTGTPPRQVGARPMRGQLSPQHPPDLGPAWILARTVQLWCGASSMACRTWSDLEWGVRADVGRGSRKAVLTARRDRACPGCSGSREGLPPSPHRPPRPCRYWDYDPDDPEGRPKPFNVFGWSAPPR